MSIAMLFVLGIPIALIAGIVMCIAARKNTDDPNRRDGLLAAIIVMSVFLVLIVLIVAFVLWFGYQIMKTM